MFLEEKKVIKLGNRKESLSLKEMGLPEPKSKFWEGDGLTLPNNFDIYSSDTPGVYENSDQFNVLFESDKSFNFPILLYIQLYKDTYDSNDLNYVTKEVLTFQRKYIQNLYEVNQWKDKKTVTGDLKKGLLPLSSTMDWLYESFIHTLS